MFRILGAICLVACLCLGAHGQSASTTALVGNVVDSAGAAISDAAVTVVNVETKEAYSAKTNAEGYYEVQFIKAGTYAVTSKKDGFESITQTGVNVSNNQVVRADFAMKVGRMDQIVEVSAGLPRSPRMMRH